MQSELKILPERHVSENAAELWSAERVWLDGRARSLEARELVDSVCAQVKSLDTRLRVGAARLEKLHRGTEAFLSVLLLAQASGASQYVQLPTGAASFSGEEVSRHTFRVIRDAFSRLGLVADYPGFKAQFERGRGAYTRFGATGSLLELAAAYGIQSTEAARHFKPGLPREPLILKASKYGDQNDSTSVLGVPDYLKDSAVKIREDVRGLNAFLDKQEITHCIHNGYVRVFNCGDRSDFNWNMGGRLYSQGAGNYQHRPEHERLNIRINGEAVCEIDLRASYLTLFLASKGQQLELGVDPYSVGRLGGFSRRAVKRWFTVSFGQGALLRQWSAATIAEEREKSGTDLIEIDAKQIAEAALNSYPLLAQVEESDDTPPLWARLMFAESEIVVQAMQELRQLQIPSLAMHDGLIVPRGEVATAQNKLLEAFTCITGGFDTSLTANP